MSKERLTAIRCNGIKTGYWSLARKDELVQRLGEYEDICPDPDKLRELLRRYQESHIIDMRAKQ